MKLFVHPGIARSAIYVLVALAVLVTAPIAGAATEAAAKQDTDSKSAAERRAAGSAFEREKLDSSAFEEKGSSSKATEKPSKGGSIGRMFFGLVVVLGVIFGVNYLLKRWGQSRLQGASGTAGVIDVVATTPLAQNRSLHLVRVGGDLVLIGATEQSITQLGTVDSADLASDAGGQGKGEFQAMLSGAMLGSQPGVPQGMGGAGSEKKSLIGRILGNLQLMTAR